MAHLHQIFAAVPPDWLGVRLTLEEREAHHLFNVVRLNVDTPLIVVDQSTQRRFRGRVTHTEEPKHKGSTRYEVIIESLDADVNTANSYQVVRTLFLAHCKGKVTDFLIEKSAELGCTSVVIWRATHSIARFDSMHVAKEKVSRWQQIALGAAQQSLQCSIPTVDYSLSLREAVGRRQEAPSCPLITCSLSAHARSINELTSTSSCLLTPPQPQVDLCIGPEGDFTQEEEAFLASQESLFLSLGSARLRVDTAALYAIGLLNGALQSS